MWWFNGNETAQHDKFIGFKQEKLGIQWNMCCLPSPKPWNILQPHTRREKPNMFNGWKKNLQKGRPSYIWDQGPPWVSSLIFRRRNVGYQPRQAPIAGPSWSHMANIGIQQEHFSLVVTIWLWHSQFAMVKYSPFLSSVNHLFLWAIYTMAMLVITRGYWVKAIPCWRWVPVISTSHCMATSWRASWK